MKQINKKAWMKTLGLFSLSATLVACNEGVSGIEADDTTPDPIVIPESMLLYCPGEEVVTQPIQITGVNKPLQVLVEKGLWDYRASSWDEDTFKTSGVIHHQDQLILRTTLGNAASWGIESKVELKVGGRSSVLSLYTQPKRNPDQFTIKDVLFKAEQNALVASEAFTVTGLAAETEISVENGMYRINEVGDFTSAPGRVNNGDRVEVQVQTPDDPNGEVTATLTIGEEQCGTAPTSETFYVNNGLAKPEAELRFPPANSMTTGSEVTVRVAVSDADASDTTDISVVVRDKNNLANEYTATFDAPNWTADVKVAVADGLNEFEVVVTDSDGQSPLEPTSVTITKGAIDAAYPNAEYPLDLPTDLGIDLANNKLYVADRTGTTANRWIYQVDLTTGSRTDYVRPYGAAYANARGLEFVAGNLYFTNWQANATKEAELSVSTEKGKKFPFTPYSQHKEMEELIYDAARDRFITVDSISAAAAANNMKLLYFPRQAPDEYTSLPGYSGLRSLTDSVTIDFSPEGVVVVPAHGERAEQILVSLNTAAPRRKLASTYPASTNIFSFTVRDEMDPNVQPAIDALQAKIDDDATPAEDKAKAQASIDHLMKAAVKVDDAVVWWVDGEAISDTENRVALNNIPSMAYDANRDRLLVASFDGNATDATFDVIYSIDPTDKSITPLYQADDAVNPIKQIDNISYDPALDYAFATDFSAGAILAVDLVSGERVYITKSN